MSKIEKEKENLKNKIKEAPLMILNDVDSFLYLRSSGLEEFKALHLGGGNLLSLMGQFSVFNFVAKIYRILLSKWDGISEINEEDAFVRLIKNYPNNLGISKEGDAAAKIWKWFRNKTSHVATLPIGTTAVTVEYPRTSFSEAKGMISCMRNNPFIIRTQEEIDNLSQELKEEGVSENDIKNILSNQCNVDLLNKHLKEIIKWLCSEIDSGKFLEEDIVKANKWIVTMRE